MSLAGAGTPLDTNFDIIGLSLFCLRPASTQHPSILLPPCSLAGIPVAVCLEPLSLSDTKFHLLKRSASSEHLAPFLGRSEPLITQNDVCPPQSSTDSPPRDLVYSPMPGVPGWPAHQ